MQDKTQKIRLTENDRRIIALLQLDSRRTVSDIAARIGISRASVKQRIETMRTTGLIRRFTLDLDDVVATDDDYVRAFFKLHLKRPVCKLVHTSISGWPELLGFWSVAGELDAMALVAARDAGDIDELRDRLARHSDVKAITTLVVLKEWANRRHTRS